MLVSELIELLNKCNPDSFVTVKSEDGSLSYIRPVVEQTICMRDDGDIIAEVIISTDE